MKSEIAPFRLLAAAILAFGFAAPLTAAPASAQETPQETPWYMPPSWVHPPRTGPVVRKLPGQYGHNPQYRYRPYGSFSTGCYGDCTYLPGTISTGYGVTLSRPVMAIFDPELYQVVQRTPYLAEPPGYQQQGYAPLRSAAPANPAVVPVRYGQKPVELPQPKFTMQNGVRIIRPAPLTAN